MGLVLQITKNQWERITAHLTEHLPEEACGLLGGQNGQVETVYLITNADHSPVSYDMAPIELLHALTDIDDRDLQILGIFHSHPSGPPMPSATDIAQAYYPDSAYFIFSPARDETRDNTRNEWQARVFEIKDGAVRELSFEVV
jgi:[CysO sulfur-carrier protein]-S-L-cysteine hydrolase